MIVQSKERPARVVTVGSKVLVAVCIEERSKEISGEVEQYFEFEQLEYDTSFSTEVLEAIALKYDAEALRKRLDNMTITPLQAKLQLYRVGLLDEVDAMVATDREVQLYWEFALEIRRTHPTLIAMAAGLGLTDEQLDELFVEAAKIS